MYQNKASGQAEKKSYILENLEVVGKYESQKISMNIKSIQTGMGRIYRYERMNPTNKTEPKFFFFSFGKENKKTNHKPKKTLDAI